MPAVSAESRSLAGPAAVGDPRPPRPVRTGGLRPCRPGQAALAGLSGRPRVRGAGEEPLIGSSGLSFGPGFLRSSGTKFSDRL